MGRGENTTAAAAANREQRKRTAKRMDRRPTSIWSEEILQAEECNLGVLGSDPRAKHNDDWADFKRSAGLERQARRYYEAGMSLQDVAEVLSHGFEMKVGKGQVHKMLGELGVEMKRAAKDAPSPVFALNPNGPNFEKIRRRALEDAADEGWSERVTADKIADQVAAERTCYARMYDHSHPVFSRPEVSRQLMRRILMFHGAGALVRGFNFEDALAQALEDAGYNVALYRAGNAGADVAIGCADDELLVPYSLKSMARKDQIGTIEIDSLAKHDLGIPDNVGDFNEAIEKAIEHLDGYQNVACLQALDLGDSVRYNLIEVDKGDLQSRRAALGPEDFARANRTKSYLAVPILDENGEELFKVRIFKNRIAIASIQPKLFRVQMSLWAPSPRKVREVPAELGQGPVPISALDAGDPGGPSP